MHGSASRALRRRARSQSMTKGMERVLEEAGRSRDTLCLSHFLGDYSKHIFVSKRHASRTTLPARQLLQSRLTSNQSSTADAIFASMTTRSVCAVGAVHLFAEPAHRWRKTFPFSMGARVSTRASLLAALCPIDGCSGHAARLARASSVAAATTLSLPSGKEISRGESVARTCAS